MAGESMHHAGRRAEPDCEPSQSSLPRSALVLYGSETGNSQDVAAEIGRLTERLRFDTTVIDLDSIELHDLLKHTIVIIAISTAGQGEMPQNARLFWKVLLSRRLKAGVLRRVNFTTFGLGDSSYPRYNVAHRMLHGRLLQLGAQLFCQRGEGNEQHPEGHSADFRTWICDLKESLIQHFPLHDGHEPIADDQFIEPKWMLQTVYGDAGLFPEEDFGTPVLTPETPPGGDLILVKDAFVADLLANPRITPVEHHQDVRLLDFAIPKHVPYGPGAVAVIYPKNFPQDVAQFIDTMGWRNIADSPIQLVATQTSADLTKYPPSPLRHVDFASRRVTLRRLLTEHIDILSIPRRSFFASLAYFTKDGNEDDAYQKERVLELANPELIDELWDYTTRPRRTILEVMPDFPSIRIPWQYALSILPIMRGRQFSIASGGNLKSARPGETRVQLLVAIAQPPNPIIKYRKRYGVCTRYVVSLMAGQKLSISIQQGYLNIKPEEARTPVIMIGPGTGVAPMRSLIYERLSWSEQDGKTEAPLAGSVLFFGCRNRGADYFFSEEWQRLEKQGLKVFAGFSRDRDSPRTYVQELLRAQSVLVHDLLTRQKCKVYVCGSSGNMPKGVREALVDVLQEHGGLAQNDAELALDLMEKEGRYKQETW